MRACLRATDLTSQDEGRLGPRGCPPSPRAAECLTSRCIGATTRRRVKRRMPMWADVHMHANLPHLASSSFPRRCCCGLHFREVLLEPWGLVAGRVSRPVSHATSMQPIGQVNICSQRWKGEEALWALAACLRIVSDPRGSQHSHVHQTRDMCQGRWETSWCSSLAWCLSGCLW